MYTGNLISGLQDTVVARQERDFVGMDECLEEAKKQLAERHSNIDQIFGGSAAEFITTFAANVAWNCAAEASKRAKK